MSYTYLQEQGEVSSAESFSDIPASVLSRLNLTADKCSCNGSETESCPSSPSGTMCEHLTDAPGKDSLTACVADFHAVKSAQQESALGLPEKEADFGEKCPESFAKLNLITCSWKTRQPLLFVDWEQSLATWPRWGLMQLGECWELAALVPCIGESAYGWLPTPSATDTGCRVSGNPVTTRNGSLRHIGKNGRQSQFRLSQVVHLLNPEIVGSMNPAWQEWLMGWPIGQTDLKPLETAKFQQWLSLHGKPSHNNTEQERTGQ